MWLEGRFIPGGSLIAHICRFNYLWVLMSAVGLGIDLKQKTRANYKQARFEDVYEDLSSICVGCYEFPSLQEKERPHVCKITMSTKDCKDAFCLPGMEQYWGAKQVLALCLGFLIQLFTEILVLVASRFSGELHIAILLCTRISMSPVAQNSQEHKFLGIFSQQTESRLRYWCW